MKKHKFEIGEVVNDSLVIVNTTRHGKENRLAYEVQSIIYPTAPKYIILERKIDAGQGCSYSAGKRVFEGNSLYSVEWVRPYLINIEDAKTITPYSSKKIIFKCPNIDCKYNKEMTPAKLVGYGFSCPYCSKGTSYPELFILAYMKVKGLNFKHQYIFNDFKDYRFDFYDGKNRIAIETHGRQHYEEVGLFNHKKSVESDKAKRQYCKENNIKLIELDCRKSVFEFIEDSINKCGDIPNISKDDKIKIINIIENNKRYPVKKIIRLYINEEKSTIEIAKILDMADYTICKILKNNDIKLRGSLKKGVRCLNTGEVFDTIESATIFYGLSKGMIGRVCRGERNSTGEHPITKEKLKWEYIEE